ncbi:UNVERIFIED_CONTAM: hypothetical protein Sradi_6846000 [Sesamum radiatum]|uniref:DUF4218 domain-containing protein n=1 Tax=Sesamum radiatum TaxID=300843 RepID=A0AAW2JNI6_SESRA
MYNKYLLERTGLTPEFQDGVKTFIEWAKESVAEYFETATVPLVSEEPTPTAHVEANNDPHWSDEQHMDWVQRMVFDAAGPSYFFSSDDAVPDMVQADPRVGPKPVESPYVVLRYLPLTPRLQRLCSSRATVEHMMWNATHQTEERSMRHPSDVKPWKHFDQMYPLFAEESHNVRLGLCTDGFTPHGQYGSTYSCCSVIITPYNFPLNVRPCYGQRIHHAGGVDVDYERPTRLWDGFWMEYPRVMGCLVCMDDIRAFHLQHGRKACYFDCHRQFFPKQHPYRRNKKAFTKNCVENKVARPRLSGNQLLDWLQTLALQLKCCCLHLKAMDIKGKTKENLNAHQDLNSICNRPELELDERRPNVMLKTAYTLSKEHKRRVCEWIKGLQFPDGYASYLARCVDIAELRMHGMKSHDYHVFMQKLIPIAFREMLPKDVWSALIEVSLLFQSICSTTLNVHKLHELENSVSIILCNLEKIFPPAFFDSMEYLIVHLPYEARVGGQCNTGGCPHLKGSCAS